MSRTPGLLLRECHALSAYRSGESGAYDGGPSGKLYPGHGNPRRKAIPANLGADLPGCRDLNVTEVNAFKDRCWRLFCHAGAFPSGGSDDSRHDRSGADAACRLQRRGTAESYQEYFTKIGEHRLAKEYGQVYGLVTELLKRLSDLLGEERVSRKEYLEILDAGFAELKVGVIPAVADRVVVGTLPEHVWLISGCSFLPASTMESYRQEKSREACFQTVTGIFWESIIWNWRPPRGRKFQQRFYLYLMMTKPSKQLILSWCRTGADGKSRRPSFLIGSCGPCSQCGLDGSGDAGGY